MWTMDGVNVKMIKLLNLWAINSKRCTLMGANIKNIHSMLHRPAEMHAKTMTEGGFAQALP